MPATDEDIRIAAENLLQSSQQHQNVQSPIQDMCKKRIVLFIIVLCLHIYCN